MHPFELLDIGPSEVGIHWFWQNSFAIKDATGTILLVDPYFPRQRHGGREAFLHPQPPLDEAELRVNHILLTHSHGDHTCTESLLRIHQAWPEARYWGPEESMARIRVAGVPEWLLSIVAAGDSVQVGTTIVHAVWSKPPLGVPEEGIEAPDVQHLGYVVEAGQVRVYVTGDLINTFASHSELMAPVAKLEPDIGLLTTHPTEGEFPFFEGSVEMAVRLGLRAAVPAHYGCFAARTYDPGVWAAMFPKEGPEPIIIPYNTSIVYQP